ncbi:SPW repeat domain-containing protein [Litoreibacter albidus]|uniref:SPW repeat domain-containing protein n=1 Tax=Litoreibacter albidus TaxID=670155 RepID=UPI00373588CC
MSLRFITPNMHGVLDYIVGTTLIVAPGLLGLGASSPLAFWLSVLTGLAVIAMSLITDYRFSVAQIIPFWLHLTVDAVAAVVFLVAPFAFGFAGLDFVYYLVNAAAVLIVVAFGLTEQPESDAAAA